MATHDYVIANQSGAAFRTDLNNALAAIVSNNSNSSEPATKYAYQWWADTSASIFKIRNSSNDGWINLFTLAGGIDVDAASNFAAAVTFTDDVTFDGATAGRDIVFDRSQNALEFADSAELRFGTGDDMKIYHDGTNSLQFFDSMVGGVRFRTNVTASARSNIILGTGVALYYDNVPKLETISGGVDISGDLIIDGAAGGTLTLGGSAAHTSKLVIASNDGSSNGNLLVEGGDGGDFFTINSAGNVIFEDNKKAIFGAGSDLQIYHDGNSRIDHNGSGAFVIRTQGTNEDIQLLSARDILLRPQGGENGININGNGAVELYYDDEAKLVTASDGARTNGRHQFATDSGTTGGFTHILVSGTISNAGTFTAQTHNTHAGGLVTITTNRRPTGSNHKNISIFPIVLNSTSTASLGTALSSMSGSSGSSFSVTGTSQGVIVTNTSGLDQRVTVRFDITG